jgi:hypothetical protein
MRLRARKIESKEIFDAAHASSIIATQIVLEENNNSVHADLRLIARLTRQFRHSNMNRMAPHTLVRIYSTCLRMDAAS